MQTLEAIELALASPSNRWQSVDRSIPGMAIFPLTAINS